MAESTSNRINLSLDLKVVCLVLVAIILGMLGIWKPWNQSGSHDRTVKVTGETTLKATPDEFLFYPTYEIKNADKEAAIASVAKKSDEVIAGLKNLGVSDNQIKSNSYGDNYRYYPTETSDETTYSLQLTITVSNQELAQKVQDYLLTTTPMGTITPQASFSDAKRKELENKARDEATKEARSKADQSAKNLGFKVGQVKSVEDGTGFGDIIPLDARAAELDASVTSSLAVMPGENELNYSVTVTYFLR